ncbi:MAG: hypothetical protein ATN36_05510 [Epulopiscium sp. Nele67-Bin005]|nr:MAG: hypothetical protein ATN36_05510 [Epulopiscium sp. Nele67-Bin005]
MPKFFVESKNIDDKSIMIIGENYNHAVNVLRLKNGDEILINDRQGNDYQCIINCIEKNFLTALINCQIASCTEPTTKVILFQSLIKGEKMDWVIQKAVELGVTQIIPLNVSRCVVKLEEGKKLKAKIERWNKISETAAKQSGRGVIPIVETPMNLKEAVCYATQNSSHQLIPYEKETKQGIKEALQNKECNSVSVFIGPEGGFTQEEVAYSLQNGVQCLTLGPRILKSETASIVVLANIMYEMGEMKYE